MPDLKLLVLGQPRLTCDDTPIELNLRKALALLVFLAVSARPHSRDALATLLWPDSDAREGRTRLRRTLHRLHEAIGDQILDRSADTIGLHPQAGLWLDSAAFRQHATAGLAAAAHAVVAPERLAQLNAAVALYHDDFLAGFTLPDSPAFDEWQFFQRETLRQLYGQVLEQLVQAHRHRQDWAAAILDARKWVALDALHEPAHRTLMRLYVAAGQHAAAVRQYQECARILAAEVGAVPEEDTTALYEAIRTRRLDAPEPAEDQPVQRLQERHVAGGQRLEPRPQARAATAVAPVAEMRSRDDQASPSVFVALPPPAAAGALRAAWAPAPAADDPVFVAREPELAWLTARLDAALDRQLSVAFVLGEAGQGKTALLHAFAHAAHAAHPDLLVAWGSGNAYTGSGDPYLPFRQILELLTANRDLDALAGHLHHDHAERLWRNLPAAAQALLDAGPDLLDTLLPAHSLLRRATAFAPDAAWAQQLHALAEAKLASPINPHQQDLFEQYARVLQQLARRTPLLLILDDLQWADPASAEMLLHLGRRLRGWPVLLLGAFRPAEVAIGRLGQRHPLEPVLGELQRDFGAIRLDLAQAHGRDLIDALLDSEPNQLGPAFRDALFQQTAGHPLFTLELLRDLHERGALERDGLGRWIAAPELHWTGLPARVEGAIGERVGRLAPRLRELLEVASVEGDEFTAEVVAQVLGLETQAVVRQLSRELDQTHRLVRALGVRGEDGVRLSRYRFEHSLIQRYVYRSLDAVERLYQHEAVGHALELRYGERAGEIAAQLAWHFAAAQQASKAGHYSEQAGDHARRAAALAEAVQAYQAALAAWPPAEVVGRARLLRKLGESQWMRGQLQDALSALEACDELYRAGGNVEGAGAVQRMLGRLFWEKGDWERTLGHYHRALALLEQRPESVELARTISSISEIHTIYSAYDEAISWGQRALALADRLGAEHVVVQTLVNVGSAYLGVGDVERGEALLRRSWQRGVELDLPHDACRAAYNLGVSLTDLGHYAEARLVVQELHSYAARQQLPLFAGMALITLAKLDWLTGRWHSALARRSDILEWIDRSQSISYMEVLADTTFGWMHNDMGQAEVARALLEHAQPKVEDRGEIFTTASHLAQQMRTLGLLGCAADASEAAGQYLGLLAPQPAFIDTYLSTLAVCRWFASRGPELRAELHASVAQLEATLAMYNSPVILAALSEARGLAAMHAGQARNALDDLQVAVAQWQALGRPYDHARVLHDLGQALAQAGEAAGAQAALEQAHGLIEQLAAQLEDPEQQAAFRNSPLGQALEPAKA